MKPKTPTKTDPIVYMRFAADAVGEMPGDGDPEKSEDGLRQDGHQHKIARSAEHRRSVGEDEGADDI